MPLDPNSLANIIHSFGVKRPDLWVILSPDQSSIVKDPGTNRPWYAKGPTARKVAEQMAKSLSKALGCRCIAASMEDALGHVLKHPKNQPND